MPRRLVALFVWILAFVAAACGSGTYYATATPAPAGSIAVVDEVASGLPSVDARGRDSLVQYATDPAGSPMAGAYFSDAGEGDVRARTEKLLGDLGASHWQRISERDKESQEPVKRLLIHTGSVAVEVPQPEAAIEDLLRRVEEWGGYMQSRVGTTVTVRVPAERFDAAFDGLQELGRVLSQSRRANDVTEEYLDVAIRLGNARKSRERLLVILEQAEKVEDVLKIEEQLRRLTDEIETMEGRRRFLADQVALATLSAEFRAVSEPPPDRRRRRPSRFGWINLIGAERIMEDF